MRNSCGSESRKGERKQTVSTSTRSGKERMRNQAKENVEDERSESRNGHWRSHCEAGTGRRERKKQRLSSQNPKLKRTKESGNGGGRKQKGSGQPWNGRPKSYESMYKGESEEAAVGIESDGR